MVSASRVMYSHTAHSATARLLMYCAPRSAATHLAVAGARLTLRVFTVFNSQATSASFDQIGHPRSRERLKLVHRCGCRHWLKVRPIQAAPLTPGANAVLDRPSSGPFRRVRLCQTLLGSVKSLFSRPLGMTHL